MIVADLDNKQFGLLFDIRRSARYHDRRRAFFCRMHRVTGVLTIILAGGVLFELAGTGSPAAWLQCVGVFAAVLSGFDIVVGYAASANVHTDLRAKFIDLEMKMLAGGADDESWQSYQQERLTIERNEPPVYRALDLLCHNELLWAEGVTKAKSPDDFAEVSFWQRLTSHILHWPNIAAA